MQYDNNVMDMCRRRLFVATAAATAVAIYRRAATHTMHARLANRDIRYSRSLRRERCWQIWSAEVEQIRKDTNTHSRSYNRTSAVAGHDTQWTNAFGLFCSVSGDARTISSWTKPVESWNRRNWRNYNMKF